MPDLFSLLDELESVVGALDEGGQEFAKSLIEQGRRRGKLSPKQLPWIEKLIVRACSPLYVPKVEEVGIMVGVIALFNKAKSNGLKYPKLHMSLDDGAPVVLSIMGNKAKHPGCVNVTDGGKFGTNIWYGRITPDGKMTTPKNKPWNFDLVKALLRKLSKDPVTVANDYAKMHGHCMFCNSPISHEKSTSVGYGPVCAGKWGLPWGGK